MWTAVLPASKGGHRCLTILIQSFNYSINACFQIKSLAKVEAKVAPVPLVWVSSSNISDCRVESGVNSSSMEQVYSRCYPGFVVASRWT